MNMRNLVLGFSLLFIASISHAAGATKVAVLDLQAVVLTSNAGKGGMSELEKNPDYSTLKAKLENLDAELKTLDDELKGKGLTWGEDKKKSHREKMTEVAKDRQGALMTLNRARESVFVQLLGGMEADIGAALEEIMRAEGIELILDSKAAIHKMPTADITTMVVEKLNKQQSAAKDKKAKK